MSELVRLSEGMQYRQKYPTKLVGTHYYTRREELESKFSLENILS